MKPIFIDSSYEDRRVMLSVLKDLDGLGYEVDTIKYENGRLGISCRHPENRKDQSEKKLREALEAGYGTDGSSSVRELNSEATAIKLMGLALEKLEKEMLRKMGVQIGGICPTIEIVEQHSDWLEGVRVSMVFDIQKLNEYFKEAEGST